jgi:replicative DNA helicase
MKARDLAYRFLARHCRASVDVLRSGHCDAEIFGAIHEAHRLSQSLPMVLWSPTRVYVDQIRSACRVVKASMGLGLVVVDYIQFIPGRNKRDSRREQLTEISSQLKAIALELDVPVLALAQLNREGAKNEEPQLHHIAECGGIEQDADQVWLLHRDKTQRNEAELIIAKSRNGRTGRVPLEFRGASTTFVERSPPRHGEFDDWNQGTND